MKFLKHFLIIVIMTGFTHTLLAPTKTPAAIKQLSKLDMVILKAAIKYRVPPIYLKALIAIESEFKQYALSRSGARGYTQLMPATAWEACKLKGRRIYNARLNINCGAKYYGWLGRLYRGDWIRATACYNAGPGRCRQWKRRGFYIPRLRETVRHVKKFKVAVGRIQRKCASRSCII